MSAGGDFMVTGGSGLELVGFSLDPDADDVVCGVLPEVEHENPRCWANMSVGEPGPIWTGVVDTTGQIEGTWTDAGDSGCFTGQEVCSLEFGFGPCIIP